MAQEKKVNYYSLILSPQIILEVSWTSTGAHNKVTNNAHQICICQANGRGLVEAVLTRGSKKWQALASYLHVAAVHGALGQLLHLCSTHQHYRAVVATIYALHCARVSSSFFLCLLF